jgi:hypothetical protein
MMMLRMCLLAAVLWNALIPQAAAAAQYGCNEPTSNEWLADPPTNKQVEYDSPNLLAVTNHLETAIAMLDKRSVVALPPDQVRLFTGRSVSKRGLRAYLVRAVYPTLMPRVGFTWIAMICLCSPTAWAARRM